MPQQSVPSNDAPMGNVELPASHNSAGLRAADGDLRESERKYRTVVDSTPQGFWLIDCERRTQEVNQAGLRLPRASQPAFSTDTTSPRLNRCAPQYYTPNSLGPLDFLSSECGSDSLAMYLHRFAKD